jgi:hypothetical protein
VIFGRAIRLSMGGVGGASRLASGLAIPRVELNQGDATSLGAGREARPAAGGANLAVFPAAGRNVVYVDRKAVRHIDPMPAARARLRVLPFASSVTELDDQP